MTKIYSEFFFCLFVFLLKVSRQDPTLYFIIMVLFSNLILLLLCIVCVWCVCACVHAPVSCQRTSLWSHFSSFACTWVPEIKPRSSGLWQMCFLASLLPGPWLSCVLRLLLTDSYSDLASGSPEDWLAYGRILFGSSLLGSLYEVGFQLCARKIKETPSLSSCPVEHI